MSPGVFVALLCGVLVAYFNGANDVSKGIATLAGSGVTDYRHAILWGTLWTGLGALASSALSSAMVGTFGAGLLVRRAAPTLTETLAVLLGVATCVGLATRFGLPVSTTHAVVGSVAGVYSFALGFAGVNWAALGGKVALPLLLSPVLALGLVVSALRAQQAIAMSLHRIPECLCVDIEPTLVPETLSVGGSSPALVRSTQMKLAVGSEAACATESAVAFRVTSTHLHWLTSGATSFARGLNDTPKIVALVLLASAVSGGTSIPQSWALVTIAMAIVAGSWIAGKKVTKVLAEEVTPMDHHEGFIANLVTAALVGPGAVLGLPMSTTHVSSGAIIGVGIPKERSLNWNTVRSMVLAWVVTVPLAAVLGVSAFLVFALVHAR